MRQFFSKLSSALHRFLYGRNGADQLGTAMLAAYLILCVLRMAAVLITRSHHAANLFDSPGGGDPLAMPVEKFGKAQGGKRPVSGLVAAQAGSPHRRQGPAEGQRPPLFPLQELRRGVPGAGGEGAY